MLDALAQAVGVAVLLLVLALVGPPLVESVGVAVGGIALFLLRVFALLVEGLSRVGAALAPDAFNRERKDKKCQ